LVGRPASWNIGAQGQWTNLGYNVIAASNNGKQLATVSLPAQVSDNHLFFTISNTTPGNDNSLGVLLSGFSIAPDSSAPHLALSDSNGNTATSTVPVNTTRQFNAVGWYMSNAVNWAIAPQIGSISASGLYTAPTTPQTGSVTITATSQSDATQTASMVINLVEGTLTVTGGAASLPRSLTTQFADKLNGGAYANVAWSASLGSISPTGLYTAPDPLPADTTAVITATSQDDATLTANFTIKLLANIPPIRINSGDWYTNITDAQGNVWLTDRGADLGSTYDANPYTVVTGTDIYGAPLSSTSLLGPVYNSSHYSLYTPANQFTYKFPVPNGNYQVTLLFADYGSTSNMFLFNVLANGTQMLSNINPDAGGFRVGSSQSFNVAVTNKVLALNFVGVSGKVAEVSGIQIVAVP